ncbi:hypothetical protein B0H13DRAFT_1634004 [Mycena leptocephala]|nr:hypothetical protein B0H13DRAFT_1634004 [Mycena leptocephala]
MESNHQASLSVKFIVVGGSISGLSCGYVLWRAGHEVVILEKMDGKTKTGGSIRSPPNMTRIISEWPGMEDLLQRATHCSGISFRRADTSEPVGVMKFHEQIMSELEADFLVLQHDDLWSYLTSLCLAAGAVIRYDCKVVDVKTVDGSAIVTLEDGSSLDGDIIIGADGHNSLVRAIILSRGWDSPAERANISIPAEVVGENQDLKSLCNCNEVSRPVFSNAEIFNFSICSPTSLEVEGDNWDASRPAKKLPFDLSGYDPRLQNLIHLGNSCPPTVHQVFVRLDADVLLLTSRSRYTAIEDAATLGRLFSRLSNRNQIPLLLNAYQEIKHSRTSATQDSEYQSLIQISLASGILREARDTALKATLNQVFEDFLHCGESDMLVQAWEQYLVLFSHNAVEEVDNWWSMWGSVVEMA